MSLCIIIKMSKRQADQPRIIIKQQSRPAVIMTYFPKIEAQQQLSEVNIRSESSIPSSRIVPLPSHIIPHPAQTVTLPTHTVPQSKNTITQPNVQQSQIYLPQQQIQDNRQCQRCYPQIMLLEKSIERMLQQFQQHTIRQIQNNESLLKLVSSMLEESQKFHERFLKLTDDVRHNLRQLR